MTEVLSIRKTLLADLELPAAVDGVEHQCIHSGLFHCDGGFCGVLGPDKTL